MAMMIGFRFVLCRRAPQHVDPDRAASLARAPSWFRKWRSNHRADTGNRLTLTQASGLAFPAVAPTVRGD
jgi:hypothetical protein